VLKLKRKVNGNIKEYKTRLVAKGYHQPSNVDFEEIFNPMVKQTTIRIFFLLAIFLGWCLNQIDGFLKGGYLWNNSLMMVFCFFLFFLFFFFHVCNHLLISHSHSHMKDLINCIYILFANNLS
jgi:hypothetical protein